MRDLEGRTAVVTGGGGGIGEALCRAFADAGMAVVVADIDVEHAQRVADAIGAQGGRAIARSCDVAQRSSTDALADAAFETFGGVHLLCNNAGVIVQRPLIECSEADFEWIFAVNVRGVMNGIWSFVPRMREQGGEAHVVNTASTAGLVPLEGHGLYCASKHAVVALSRVLRDELAGSGIGVSVLCPAGVATRILEAGRNRQQAFGGPASTPDAGGVGQAAVQARQGGGPSGLSEVLQPADVAQLVVAAVRADELFVHTHPAWREPVDAAQQEVLRAFDRCAERRPPGAR